MNVTNWRLWAVVLLGLTVTGCSKLTHERWLTIHDQASDVVVKETLGDPWQTTDNRWIYHDADRGITATIYFENDRVIAKKWADPERGIEGKSPYAEKAGYEESIDVQTIE